MQNAGGMQKNDDADDDEDDKKNTKEIQNDMVARK